MASNATKTTNIPSKYSFAQLEQLWIKAGGQKTIAPIMAAIALAESGGNPKAVSGRNQNGTVDRGLWQINSSHGYGTSSLDPVANAKQATGIYHSQGLNAWTTFQTGAYKTYLAPGITATTARTKTASGKPSFIGDLGHDLITNPTAVAGDLTGIHQSNTIDPLGNILLTGLKEAMYALAILGGGMLILLGLLLIGVDIGLEGISQKASKHPAVRIVKRITPSPSTSGKTQTITEGESLPGPE